MKQSSFLHFKPMKISIITVAYNSEGTIRQTIESVLKQTYSNIEYIIVDGASLDDTLNIVKKYKKLFGGRLRYVSGPDKGIYDAMNKGVLLATGDVVGILNSDDLLFDEHVISDIAHTFKEYNVDCVYGDLIFVKPNNTNKPIRSWFGSQYFKNAFLKGWSPAHPTFYVRRECYNNFGLYDISMKVSADFDLMMRFLAKHEISNKYMRRNFVKMRYGGESTGSIKNIYKGNDSIKKAFKKNGVEIPRFYFFRRLSPKLLNLLKNKIHPVRMPYEGC